MGFLRIGARVKTTLAFFVLGASLTGCASYQMKVNKARGMMTKGNPHGAVKALEPLANQEGKDQLVYLLDFATACQQAGDFERSNRAFLAADQMSEVKDYHSISKLTASMLGSQSMVQYKGDDYEKVLINAMLSINYLLLGNLDEAMVETRRINEKLHHYRTDAKKNYEQNPFAFYLSALIYEADRKWDDAYIDFKRTYDLNPNIPYLKEDLIRAAYNARRPSAEKKWRKEFEMSRPKDPNLRKHGEVVLIYQQGWGPRKYANPKWHRIPKLYPKTSMTNRAKLVVEGGPVEITQSVYSIQNVAIKTMDDHYAGLIAKRMAAIAAKEVVADQVRQKNETLGALLKIGMHLSDQADLRQWSTLPETFQVAKIRLKPGTYKISVQGLTSALTATGESMDTKEIVVKRGRKTFIGWRSYY